MWLKLYTFLDREEAGEKLAETLLAEPLISETSPEALLVLSIPRGGVVVGAAVAQALQCAHDVIVVKKIGFPGQRELAIGAMAEEGLVVLNLELSESPTSAAKTDYLAQAQRQIKGKLEDQIQKFRQGRSLDVQDKTVIVVDDGIATGETMKAAMAWLTSKELSNRPQNILIAVPVCSPRIAQEFEPLVDRFICLARPKWFWAVGQFYWNFDSVDDHEVLEILGVGTSYKGEEEC